MFIIKVFAFLEGLFGPTTVKFRLVAGAFIFSTVPQTRRLFGTRRLYGTGRLLFQPLFSAKDVAYLHFYCIRVNSGNMGTFN